MSWHFLQEQEEASWEASSLDGAPFALLSLMPTAAGCCLPDSGTDSCRDSQSGTMCRPSTGSRGGGGVDVVSGGFPCTDISQAKQDARGIDGDESGLWREMARIIGEVRPRFVFVENSAMLVVRGLGRVLGDLARMGFCTWHGVLGACHVGAPHNRRRIWIVGHAECARLEGQHKHGNQAQGWSLQNRPDESAGVSILEGPWRGAELTQGEDGTLRYIQPGLCGVAYGVAHRVDRLKAIGNGQVPAVAALAWRLLGGPQ